MTITTTWSIKQLDCKPQVGNISDYVVTAHWTLIGTDGTYTGSAYGSISFKEDSDKTDYIPYDQLTSEQVIGWVKSVLGETKVAELEANIDTQIADQISPPIITPKLPWA